MTRISEILIKLLRHKLTYALGFVLAFYGAVKLFSFSTYTDADKKMHSEMFKKEYKVFSLDIPEDLNFCGENVPVENFDVRESIDRELLVNTYWQSQTILYIKRANRWFPIIEPILKQYGIPDDFKYLALIESGFTNVISPAGATGFWQLLENTGKQYGLQIDSEVDERYHIEKSTIAACKYFKESYKKFGNWTLTAASYNMGITGIEKQIGKQKSNNYYLLALNEETSRYLFRILIAKEILLNPEKYGFNVPKRHLYPRLNTTLLVVDSTISDLAAFAETKQLSYKSIKLLNPWLRSNALTVKGEKKYYLKILSSDISESTQLQLEKELLNDSVAPIDTTIKIEESIKP